MPKTQEEIMKAIDSTDLASGGELLGYQADKFIDLTVDETRLMKMVRTEKMDVHKGEVDLMNIGAPVTESADENADSGNLYEPTLSKVEFVVKKLRSAFDLTKEALERNIEREGWRQSLYKSFAKRMSTDLELLGIQGDETITGITALDRLLKRNNGWYKQTLGVAHEVDAAGAHVSQKLFSDMIDAMPSKYSMDRANWKFLASPKVYQHYANAVSGRATALGDAAHQRSVPLRPFGIELVEVPLIPEDLEATIGTTAYTDLSFVWLCNTMQFIYVPLRQFDVYWEFKPRTDKWECTTYHENDYVIENTDAIVLAKQLSLSGSDYS